MPGHWQLLIALGCSLFAGSATGTPTSEDALMAALFGGYSKDARPPPSNQPTDVHIEMLLVSIEDVEERLLTITVAGIILVTWTDERLTWNSSALDGLDRLVVSANSIWKPDFALMEAVGDVFNSAFYSKYYGLTVLSTGNVTWTMQGSIPVRCDFNLTYYPFDTQTCRFRYESLNYPSYLLRIFTDTNTIDLSQYHENSEFAIMSTSAITEDFVPAIDGNYSNVIFTMTLKRRQLYFVLNLILPCVLLSVMTCFVFLLPALSGERVGLAITLLLAFSVFQLQVAGYLPMNSLSSTILTDFILTSMFFNGIALIATIFILRLSEKEDQSVPPWMEKLFLRKLGVLYGITPKVKISSLNKHDSMSDHFVLSVKRADSSKDSSFNEPTIRDERLRQLLSSVQNVEKIVKAQDHQYKQEEKLNVITKVLDMTMFLLFSIAVAWLCISTLALIPTKSS